MRNATGLRFSESLSGYLGDGADFWDAFRDGRSRAQLARFSVTVRIPDLERFFADAEHEAAMEGRVTVAGLGTAPVEDGRLHLFSRREQETLLLYYLPFERGEERYVLRGEKRLRSPRGLEAWRQMTTLYTELLRQANGGPETLLGRGVLRIGARQVFLQSLSFRPVGTLNPLRFAGNYVRFLSFSSRELRGSGHRPGHAPASGTS